MVTRGILLAVFLALPAQAEPRSAKDHYLKGTTLYDLQRFAEAAHEYEAAFELKDDPALLFNIAQAYRLGGDLPKAVGAYRSFLRRVPNTSNRAEVLARIGEMQQLIEAQRRSAEKPPSGTIVPQGTPEPPGPVIAPPPSLPPSPLVERHDERKSEERDTGRGLRIAGLAVGGVGLAALAVGGAFAGLAVSAQHDLNQPAVGTVWSSSRQSSVSTDWGVAAALLGVGGAALVTGVVVFVTGHQRRHHRTLAAIAGGVSF